MQLTLWTYEGPPHVGAMRIATAMEGVHYVLHAPQGDTYADLLFTMIERLKKRPPVTYTTFQARDLGGDTAELFKTAAREAFERFSPQAMLVGSSCTAELIQDDPGGLCKALDLPVPVVALELPSYQRKENWGASETFYQLVRALAKPSEATIPRSPGAKPRCNILGPTALGFRHRDDLKEISKLLMDMGIDINVVAPLSATPADIARLSDADFNVVLYPEIATLSAQWLERNFKQPFTKTIPIGNNATRDFIAEVARLAGIDADVALAGAVARAAWYARSVDSTYLTGKRVFVFGDATHAVAAAKVAAQEMGFTVVGIGTYSREFAREVRAAASLYGVEALISDDYLEVEAAMAKMNLAWGRIRTGKALRNQPTIAHRQSIVDVDDRAGGTRPIVQSPYRFSQAISGVRGGAPHKGEHTDEILRGWLGLSDKEIDQLAAQGILTRDTTGAD